MDANNRIVAEDATRVSPIVAMSSRELLTSAVIGLVVGVVVAAVYYLLDRFVFHAVMCRDDTTANCSDAASYAMVVAMVLGGLAGLIALVQARIYRPLLAVLATIVALWGIEAILGDVAWYWMLVICGLIFAPAYALFVWLARVRSFPLAVLLTIIVVLLIRFVLSA